jgi:hypothetical protein
VTFPTTDLVQSEEEDEAFVVDPAAEELLDLSV